MLTIGEFASLGHISPRMLRHYDALGLLRPDAVGENGYRYYRQEQLSGLVRIQRLSGYGFPLREIGPMLALDGAELLACLRERRLALSRELEDRQALLCRLETDILRMEGVTEMKNMDSVILMEDPEQRVFSIRKTVGVGEYHALFQELRREAAKRGLRQAGPIQMLYHDPDFSYERSDVEAQMAVDQEGPGVHVKPRQTCAAVRHRGPYETLHLAYEALCGWMAEHTEYRPCGPAMDRYLNDPHDTPPEALETGVLFPVERA